MPNSTMQRYALDASVVINLLATGCLEQLIPISLGEFSIVTHVQEEVKIDPITRKTSPNLLLPYIEAGIFRLVQLTEDELETFIELVGAMAPDDLDDGEAATIAIAAHRQLYLVIDESKGRRVAKERFPTLQILDTVDLLKLVGGSHKLPPKEFIRGIENALTVGKMRVAPEQVEWISNIVSREVVQQAPSIRRSLYRRR